MGSHLGDCTPGHVPHTLTLPEPRVPRGAERGPACPDPDLDLIVGRLLPVLCSPFDEIIQFLLFVANNKDMKTFTSWQPDFLQNVSDDWKRVLRTKRNLLYIQSHLNKLKFSVIIPHGHVDSCIMRDLMVKFSENQPATMRLKSSSFTNIVGVGEQSLLLYSLQAENSSECA